MKGFALVVICIFVLLFNGCSSDNLVIKMDKKTFEKERDAWVSQNLKNYQFTYEYFGSSTGPFGPINVTVSENEETIVETLCERSLSGAFMFESICDIYAHIFNLIMFAESVRNGTYDGPWKVSTVIIDVSYNVQNHYPTEVAFSVGYVEDIVGGPGHILTVSEFKILD